jgi:hypothetical protein
MYVYSSYARNSGFPRTEELGAWHTLCIPATIKGPFYFRTSLDSEKNKKPSGHPGTHDLMINAENNDE